MAIFNRIHFSLFFSRALLLAAILFTAIVSSCTGLERFEKKNIYIESKGRVIALTAELAVTDAQRQQGLMHRRILKDGEGMLFIFERDQQLSFWMKDTRIPLSIAFIASDGRIREMYNLEPFNRDPVISNRSVRYALEVPQGWFDRVGITSGDKLDIDKL